MDLFKYENYEVVISPYAFTLTPFDNIVKKYKKSEKRYAISELSYIYHFTDWNSSYADILDIEERKEKVLNDIFIKDKSKIKIDSTTDDAIAFYNDRQETLSMELRNSAKRAIKKIMDYFDKVDLFEQDSNGKYMNDVSKLVNAIEKSSSLVNKMSELTDSIKKEVSESSKLRGIDQKGMYE